MSKGNLKAHLKQTNKPKTLPGLVMYNYNPNIEEVEAGGLLHHDAYKKFQISQGYMIRRPCRSNQQIQDFDFTRGLVFTLAFQRLRGLVEKSKSVTKVRIFDRVIY